MGGEMSSTGYYFLDYRVWWDKGFLWFSIRDSAIPIPQEDVGQVIEMMVRATNDTKFTIEGRVHSTDEKYP